MGAGNRVLLVLLVLLACVWCLEGKDFKLREKIDFDSSFSAASTLSAIFATCGDINNFRKVVLSFFFYNTMPLRTVFIVDYCERPVNYIATALP